MNRKTFDNIFTVIIIVLIIIIGIKHRKERDTYDENLLSHASYAIGHVTYYLSGRSPIIAPKVVNSTGRTPVIEYYFIVDRDTIRNRYDAFDGKVPSDGIRIGEEYMVLFKKNNPSESRMFFDYPIKDSTDFGQYVKEFEGMRKQKTIEK